MELLPTLATLPWFDGAPVDATPVAPAPSSTVPETVMQSLPQGFALYLSIVAIGILLLVGFALMIFKLYRKVDQGKALIINGIRDVRVTFGGGLVFPIIHRAEVMEISLKTIVLDRRGKEGLICADNIRADIKVTFFVRVNKTAEDVLKVAQSIGCERASAQETLEDLFVAKFSEGLKTVGKRLEFEDLYKSRDDFKDQIVELIGKDLNGYTLEDAAIDFLEQTPLDLLDKENIFDAQGIRKITELTALQSVLTNDFRQNERKALTKQNVEAREAILALERQQADAEARQQREVDSIRARETAESEKVKSEEMARSELARIRAMEEIAISEQNKLRQVEVAQKNRERVVAIETERVEKDRALEAISREREVELQRIAKEKALEQEKKEIADTIRARIAVDKTVAEEEERIKDLRMLAEARRHKDAKVINAEAEAEEGLVKEVKAAEASEEVTRIEARKQLTLAEAGLEAADRDARARTRLSEGVQAEEAARGLADARVKEADAAAEEKLGLARARINEERLMAEARGLTEKAAAMKALDDASRAHEEFRIRLEQERELELARLSTRREIAEHQAGVMSEAMGKAKIQIVGGDGQFFDRFVKAISLGQSFDGAIENSETLSTVLEPYLKGDKSLPEDLKEVFSRPGLTQDAQNLAVTAALSRVVKGDGELAERLRTAAAQVAGAAPAPSRKEPEDAR